MLLEVEVVLVFSIVPGTWFLPDCMRRSLSHKSLCSHIHRPPWRDAGREAASSPPCLCASPPLPGGEPAAVWRSTAEGNLHPPAQRHWCGRQCLHLGSDPPWACLLLSGQWPHWWSTGISITDKIRRPLCRRAMQTNVEMKCTHFEFQSLQPVLSQSFSEPLSAPAPLLQCMLCHRVSLEGAVPLHHAQRGTSMAGHAGEALAPWETQHRHLVKAHVTLCTCKLGPLQDGPNWLEKRHQKRWGTVSSSFNVSIWCCNK